MGDDHAGGATTHSLGADGAVRDWLVAGPWSRPVTTVGRHVAAEGDPFGPRGRWILSKNPEADGVKLAVLSGDGLAVAPPVRPVERASVAWQGRRGAWQRRRVGDDGFVDWDGFAFTPTRQDALAGALLRVEETGSYRLRLSSTGSLSVLLDGRPVHRDLFVSTQQPVDRAVPVLLHAGDHTLVIASSVVGMREYRHVLRLAVAGAGAVVLPSPGAQAARNTRAEAVLDAVGVLRWTSCDGRWTFTGPDGADLLVDHDGVTTPLTLSGGRADWQVPERREDGSAVVSAPRRGERPVRIRTAEPTAAAARDLRLIQVPSRYRGEPAGDRRERAEELLRHAADRNQGVATQLARLQLGASEIDPEALSRSLELIRERGDCADFEVVALANLWHRTPAVAWPGGLREQVAEALRGFKYWLDEPGLDCMCYFTENHQLVYHVGELLAGELFAGDVFPNTGWSGREHAELAERRCAAWLAQRLRQGFLEFDSNTYFAIDVLALVSLIEHGAGDRLREMATAVLDLLLFQLAANSWRGIHGCAHGRSYAQALLSGRLEETSPLQRVAWGTGGLNEALLPAVVFAAARRYQVPGVIVGAGSHLPDRWDGLQRSAGTYAFDRDLRLGDWSASSVVSKTPDGMLASVQDYRPGEPGYQEHVWGATIGPDTHVFANHPANSSVSSSARPNFWAGNRLLPRVRQDGDALIALYRLPAGDPMGFTHAWFPTSTMDAWLHHDGWFIGRAGDGYVALTADGPLRLRRHGVTAGQELRAEGGGRTWVCQLGRRATHGSLVQFRDGLQRPSFDADGARYRTPDGRLLELRWDGAWRVDGAAGLTPEAFPRLRNPLTDTPVDAPLLRIDLNGFAHELDLAAGRRVPSPGPGGR